MLLYRTGPTRKPKRKENLALVSLFFFFGEEEGESPVVDSFKKTGNLLTLKTVENRSQVCFLA